MYLINFFHWHLGIKMVFECTYNCTNIICYRPVFQPTSNLKILKNVVVEVRFETD